MGMRRSADLKQAWLEISRSLAEIRSPYNDGWNMSACKKELYMLKSWLDDEYKKLPTFAEESHWEQERIIQILKKE